MKESSSSSPTPKAKTKTTVTTAPAPKLKSQHRIFALAVMSGLTHRAAYQMAYPKASLRTAEVQASRLIQRVDVLQTLERLRGEVEAAAVLSLQEKRAFLARIVRTSATDLVAGSELIQTVGTEKDGSLNLKMPDKLRAIYLDARLAGEVQSPQRPTSGHPSDKDKGKARPAHEIILAESIRALCFGSNQGPTKSIGVGAATPSQASSTNAHTSNNPSASTSASDTSSTPAKKPEHPQAQPPPSPTSQTNTSKATTSVATATITAATAPESATETEPQLTQTSLSSPITFLHPETSLAATPRQTTDPAQLHPPPAAAAPTPTSPFGHTPPSTTIRRLHIRLGRRPRPYQNSGETSLSTTTNTQTNTITSTN